MEGIELLKMLGSNGIMGIFIYILYKRYDKSETEKNELSKEVIAVILKYEFKSDQDKKQNDEILNRLKKIEDAVK